MVQLPYLNKDDLKPEDQDILNRGINLHRLLAHSPGAARAFGSLGNFIRHGSTINGRLRELAILQVGWLTKSPYEWSHHIKIGYEFGVTKIDVENLIQESDGKDTNLGKIEKTVLLGAREITQNGKMGKTTFEELAGYFSNEHLVDLLVTISFYNAVVRILASTEIDVEQSYLPYLKQFPLPE